MGRRRNMSEVNLVITGPLCLLPERKKKVKAKKVKKDLTWRQLFQNLRFRIDGHDEAFVCSTGYRPTFPSTDVQDGWKSELNEQIANYISKFASDNRKRYYVRLFSPYVRMPKNVSSNGNRRIQIQNNQEDEQNPVGSAIEVHGPKQPLRITIRRMPPLVYRGAKPLPSTSTALRSARQVLDAHCNADEPADNSEIHEPEVNEPARSTTNAGNYENDLFDEDDIDTPDGSDNEDALSFVTRATQEENHLGDEGIVVDKTLKESMLEKLNGGHFSNQTLTEVLNEIRKKMNTADWNGMYERNPKAISFLRAMFKEETKKEDELNGAILTPMLVGTLQLRSITNGLLSKIRDEIEKQMVEEYWLRNISKMPKACNFLEKLFNIT